MRWTFSVKMPVLARELEYFLAYDHTYNAAEVYLT